MKLNLEGLDGTTHKKRHKVHAKKPLKNPQTAAPLVVAPVPAKAAVAIPQPTAVVPHESSLDKLLNTAQQALPVVLSSVAAARNQKRIDKIQEQRMAAGKEPLTAEELDRYMDATAPVVKVKGGVDNNTSKYFLWGGLALGGLFLLTRKPSAKNGG